MMQAGDTDDRDEALLAELREAVGRLDPVPEAVLRAGRAAIELRDLDAQLAELLSDSATDELALAGIRGEAGRMLTFGFGDRYIEVEISGAGAHRDAIGYVVPGAVGRIVAETAGSSVTSAVDERGRFRLTGLATGPTRLRIEVFETPPLVTPWTAF